MTFQLWVLMPIKAPCLTHNSTPNLLIMGKIKKHSDTLLTLTHWENVHRGFNF